MNILGTVTLNGSKVNHNTSLNGGGISSGNGNGGIPPGTSHLVLLNSQVGNTATSGGGIFNSGGTVTLKTTSVTGNHPDNCEAPGTITGCTG